MKTLNKYGLPIAIALAVVGLVGWWLLVEKPKNDKLATTYEFV
ncbi:hypothetical protein ACAW74_18130 [Fibrella sp. WM1]